MTRARRTCRTTFLAAFSSDIFLKNGSQTSFALRKVRQGAGLEWNSQNMSHSWMPSRC